VQRFGTGHTGDVDPSKGNAPSASTGQGAVQEKGERSPSPGSQDKPAAQGDDYEWGCPSHGVWKLDRFESGEEDGLCRDEADCLCVSRGSSNSHSELDEGKEKIHGTFDVMTGRPDGSTSERKLSIIPHYAIRKLPPKFDTDNPHSDMGKVESLARDEWLLKFQDNAPFMQRSLDSLRDWIDTNYKDRVQDKPFVCGTGDASAGAEAQGSWSGAEALNALTRIRRFQMLSADCEVMRDNVAKLAPEPSQEVFAPTGSNHGKKLNCYKLKDSPACQQLNCYKGPDDETFREHMQLFKTKMVQCKPEVDTSDESAGTPPSSEGASATGIKQEAGAAIAGSGTPATPAAGAVGKAAQAAGAGAVGADATSAPAAGADTIAKPGASVDAKAAPAAGADGIANPAASAGAKAAPVGGTPPTGATDTSALPGSPTPSGVGPGFATLAALLGRRPDPPHCHRRRNGRSFL